MPGEMLINVGFYIDGVQFAERVWCAVPRVGDEVVFAALNDKPYRVVRVVWTVERQPDYRRQYVNVELAEIADQPQPDTGEGR